MQEHNRQIVSADIVHYHHLKPDNYVRLSEADLFGFENHLKQINNLMIKYQFNPNAKLTLFEKLSQLKNRADQIVLNVNWIRRK